MPPKLLNSKPEEKQNDAPDNTPETPPKPVETKQRFPFEKIEGEVLRIYMYPGGNNIPVANVRYRGVDNEGNHRLLTATNMSEGIKMMRGWLSIVYRGPEGQPIVFPE